MKRLVITLFAVFLFSFSSAQTAPKFSYQAVVRNSSNELVANDSVSVRIQFYNHTPSGAAVYSEEHRVFSNRNGLISLLVGEGENPIGDLSQVIWDDALMRTDITLRGGYTVSDVKPVTAVPVAYYAEQIPLRAIEEHLGSTNVVSVDALRDTLSHYVTIGGLTDTLTTYVTLPQLSDSLSRYAADAAALLDTLSHYVTNESLADTLENYVTASGLMDMLVNYVTAQDFQDSFNQIMAALIDLQSITTSVEEFIVPSLPTNTFQLGSQPLAGRAALFYINGVCISSTAYTVVNRQLSYLPNQNGGKELVAGDRIQFYYVHK